MSGRFRGLALVGALLAVLGASAFVAGTVTSVAEAPSGGPIAWPPPASGAPTTSGGATTAPTAAPDAGTGDCPASLQGLVDAAPPGATVEVPACLYRETVTVDKALTLVGRPGAEIRGSDTWADWSADGAGWASARSAPASDPRGECAPGTGDRCRVGTQVFRDGTPLAYVAADPGPGEFSVLRDGRVRLGDDPAGHLLEVSVRPLWVHVAADGVTIAGFTMRHSTAPAQSGGITVGGYGAAAASDTTIRDNRLSDAHGALIAVQGGSRQAITGNTLERAGQLGLALAGDAGSRDWLVQGNTIRDSNTDGFDVGWEAGGFKALSVTGLRILDNELAGDGDGDGRCAWTDTGAADVTFSGNRVHGCGSGGALFESSHGLVVERNVVWNTGWQGPEWAWGGGITLSSSDHAVIRDNLVAWNADGITVISQARTDDAPHVGIEVTDNTIVMGPRPDDRTAFALGWVEDWDGALLDPASGNGGAGNRFWYPEPEPAGTRFAWGSSFDRLDAFAATPGGTGSGYLSDAGAAAALADAGLPPPVARSAATGSAQAAGLLVLVLGIVLLFSAWWAAGRPGWRAPART